MEHGMRFLQSTYSYIPHSFLFMSCSKISRQFMWMQAFSFSFWYSTRIMWFSMFSAPTTFDVDCKTNRQPCNNVNPNKLLQCENYFPLVFWESLSLFLFFIINYFPLVNNYLHDQSDWHEIYDDYFTCKFESADRLLDATNLGLHCKFATSVALATSIQAWAGLQKICTIGISYKGLFFFTTINNL